MFLIGILFQELRKLRTRMFATTYDMDVKNTVYARNHTRPPRMVSDPGKGRSKMVLSMGGK